MANDNNYVAIKGCVADEIVFSHSVYSEGFYKFTLSVPRLSGVSDYIPVTVSERLLSGLATAIGAPIGVTGQFRSYNNYWQSGESRLKLTVFAKNIYNIDPEDMDDPNEIVLDGYLCKPPVYRSTPFGREIADLLIAVNRSYNKSDYLPVIAWGRNARFCSDIAVGTHVRICGRVQSREYQKRLDDDIVTRIAYEISVSKLEIVDE